MWKMLDKSELVASLLLVALGIYIVAPASQWVYLTQDGPGPGFFPLWTGIFIIALSAVHLGTQLIAAAKRADVEPVHWKGAGPALVGWAGFMISVALLEWAGFTASFLFLCVFLVKGVFKRSLLTAILVGLGSALAFWGLFVGLLDVQLPRGPWGF